jgi:Mce-associated membrane protein
VTNEARTRLPSEEDAGASPIDAPATDVAAAEGTAGESTNEVAEAPAGDTAEETTGPVRAGRKKKAASAAEEPDVDEPAARRRVSLPLVPVLSVLLLLLLGAGAFLWFTRPEPSAVSTDDYVGVLTAARSNIVDFTSFDHLTLDDDIEQIRRVAIGDLRDGAVEQLDSRRQEITDAEAIVSTEVIGAGVTRADDEEATVLLVIQTTRQTNASEQTQVTKYRIEVEMQRLDGEDGEDGRWVLSKITGT